MCSSHYILKFGKTNGVVANETWRTMNYLRMVRRRSSTGEFWRVHRVRTKMTCAFQPHAITFKVGFGIRKQMIAFKSMECVIASNVETCLVCQAIIVMATAKTQQVAKH